uniref:Uncharacterized protein n=1 Tax=Triticum urartu TaxID=4572 RepID=A0A8R7Q5S5_TRIUA
MCCLFFVFLQDEGLVTDLIGYCILLLHSQVYRSVFCQLNGSI